MHPGNPQVITTNGPVTLIQSVECLQCQTDTYLNFGVLEWKAFNNSKQSGHSRPTTKQSQGTPYQTLGCPQTNPRGDCWPILGVEYPSPSHILISHISFNNTVIVLYRTDKKEPALLKTASLHRRKGSIKTLGLGLTLTKQIPTHALFLQTSLTAKNKFDIIIIFFFKFCWLSLRWLQAFKKTHPLVMALLVYALSWSNYCNYSNSVQKLF